ncbi:MAG: DMT family transporter [Actinobacteria bacterium]|nr:MAG: DMT family transporter [Actinomycetota bacterium]
MSIKMTTDRRAAFAALTAAGVIWGLTVPLSKLALDWLDATWLTTARFALAAPVLAVLTRRHLRAAASASVAAWGALGFGGVLLLQNLGMERTSVSHAALIVGAVPALVAVATAAAGRAASGPVAWAGFATALAGVVVVAGAGGDASLAGDGLVLASAVLCALFIVAQSRLLADRDAIAVTAVQMAAAAAATLPLALATGSPVHGAPDAASVAAVGALVSAGSLLPFALYAYGQARVPAEVAGAFVNLEPLVGAALGALAFRDPFGGAQALGAAAILAGIVLSLERPPRSSRRARACPA